MDQANVAIRLAQYLTLGSLFGLAIFAFYARSAANLLSWRRGLVALGGLGLVASLASILILAAQMSGSLAGALDPAILWAVIGGTDAGKAWMARLLMLAAVIFAAATSRHRGLAWASGIALATLAWGGHAAAEEGLFGYVRLVGDILHLLAAGIWIGALAAFAGLTLRRSDPSVTARALASFSGVGTGLVAVLIVTGLINLTPSVAWTPLPQLTTSPWGQLLLIKLALFAAMLGLAATNRFILTPRLQEDAVSGFRHLRLSVLVELSLGIGVLALVSWLGTLAPPAAG